MYSSQLNFLLKFDKITRKNFVGVFGCDAVKFTDKPSFCIVNTAPSFHSGEHWVLFFKYGSKCLFFDSFAYGISFYGSCLNEAFSIFSRHSKYVKCNDKCLQSSESSLCGVYCLYVARELCKGKSINTIEKQFSTITKSNDAKLSRWFQLYTSSSFTFCHCCRKTGQTCTCLCEWKK